MKVDQKSIIVQIMIKILVCMCIDILFKQRLFEDKQKYYKYNQFSNSGNHYFKSRIRIRSEL